MYNFHLNVYVVCVCLWYHLSETDTHAHGYIYTMISLCMQKCFYDDSIVLSWRRNLFLFSDSNSSVVETRSRFCFVLFCFFSFFFSRLRVVG